MNATMSAGMSALIFVVIVLAVFKGMKKPVKGSGARLLLPIVFVSSSLLQLLNPELHVQGWPLLLAAAAGAVVALPLIAATNFEARSGAVYFRQSNVIFALLGAIFALRIVLMFTMTSMNPDALGLIFNVATVSYIAVWRIASFSKFRKVQSGRGFAVEQ
ncbi:CcdC protein domain-containing protein [Paenibacillus sp. HJGM_3]|uniref:CcdC protein domain-containing protein n=1 Tax=Paenibacillus sp. HJGM_3 TaxID=3379816 RepID=UPI0038589830